MKSGFWAGVPGWVVRGWVVPNERLRKEVERVKGVYSRTLPPP